MKYKSEFLNEINSRGFIYQSSDIEDLDKLMSKKKIVAYIGFDATSDSLHIGSLVQLMLLNWLQVYGHKPIALMGGGTTLIGDPSGKDEARKILQQSDIKKNFIKIKSTFLKFIDLNKEGKLINNYDWLADINYINFLRDIGQKITPTSSNFDLKVVATDTESKTTSTATPASTSCSASGIPSFS